MNFERLLRADVVAAVAALALLAVMALDWYSTPAGREARRTERLAQPEGGAAGQIEREVRERARLQAEGSERNAWQPAGGLDRLVLAGLLATVALAIASAYLRAAARRFDPPLTPATIAAGAATVTALLAVYRTIQEPALDEGTTVQAGAPIAIVVLAVIALSCRAAMGREADGSAWRERPEPPSESATGSLRS